MRPDLDLADVFNMATFQQRFAITPAGDVLHAGPAGTALTGPRLLATIARATASLRRDGIGTGDVVLFQGQQSSEAFILFWATILRGAIFAPVDPEWPDYLLTQATQKLQPKIVAAGELRWLAHRRCFPAARRILLTGPTPEIDTIAGEVTWEAWLGAPKDAAGSPMVPDRLAPTAPAAYLFTSGSTGLPKAVILSRGALAHGATVTVASFQWQRGESVVNLPEPHTMSGLRNAMVAAPLAGLSWIPLPPQQRPNLFALIEQISASRCNHLVIGPALVRQLVLLGDRLPVEDLTSLRAIYSTGATLNAAAAQAFFDRYRIPIINYYGLTETGGICLCQSRQDWDPADSSLGQAVGCEARLQPVDATSTADIGELQIRSAQLMSGYLDDPERSRARFKGDWLRTGDIMRRDPQGRYYLLGRADLFIKTASTDRVHPEELEQVLEQHPAIADVAVTGSRTELDIERVVALVVLRDTATASPTLARELARFVADHLGANRAPNDVRFVSKLPRLENGKLSRKSLGEMIT